MFRLSGFNVDNSRISEEMDHDYSSGMMNGASDKGITSRSGSSIPNDIDQ